MWKQGEIVHLKDILKIDKKGVINNKTFQNFVEFIQWIPTKHIPTLRIVRILIFVIVLGVENGLVRVFSNFKRS